MASTIDPTIWDAEGPIAKATIKASLATAAKNDIEALQSDVDDLEAAIGNAMPEGTQVVITRDSTGAAVASEAPADGTIVIDEAGQISALALLDPDEFEIVTVNASRNLGVTDKAFSTYADEDEASRVKEQILFVEATDPNDPVVLTIANNCPTLPAVNILVSGDQVGAVTLATGDAGTINGVEEEGGGEATVTIERERIFVLQNRNAGENAPRITTTGTLEDGLTEIVTDVSGTLTISAHLGRKVITSGNITVPNVPGFWVLVEAGGAHTITHNSETCPALTTGDLVPVLIGNSGARDAVVIPASAQLAFS